MNIKTKFPEDYVDPIDRMQNMNVNFVDTTKKQNADLKIFLVIFVIISTLFLFFLL